MVSEELQEELPTGEARKLARLSRREWCDRLLLFSEVRNRVIWVNPNVYIPVNLREGRSSPLGLFAEAAFEKKPKKLSKGKGALEVWPRHRRSALLGRVIFADVENRLYRDIDLKGIGLIEGRHFVEYKFEMQKPRVLEPGSKSFRGREGLLDHDSAFSDLEMSEKFLQAGIRTNRVLAIIGLEELIVNRRRIPLEQAIERNIIDKDFHPVIEVRAFMTKARVADLERPFDFEGRELLVEDAKKLIGQELSLREPLSTEEYLMWFARTFAFNVGLMHKSGWHHHYLDGINITLDSRIVDLDSVVKLTDKNEQSRDLGGARDALHELLSFFKIEYAEIEPFDRQFQESYDSVFPPEEQRRYFSRISKER